MQVSKKKKLHEHRNVYTMQSDKAIGSQRRR